MAEKPTWARWVTGISLAFALVALVWTIYSIGLDTLIHHLGRIGWWFAVVAALELVITSLDAGAIWAFLSPDHNKARYRHVVLAQVAGRAVNVVTPMGNLGEVVKVSILVDSVSESRAVSGILLYNLAGITIELVMVAICAPLVAIMVPVSIGMRVLLFATCAFAIVCAIGLTTLVRRGMLASIARLAVRLRLLSETRFEHWHARLSSVDDKLRPAEGTKPRDRRLGVACVLISRSLSWAVTAVLLHALGMSVHIGFFAAITVGGFAIYLTSTIVPLGLGVSESGWYAMFHALHFDPVIGVTISVAKRVTQVVYATIGLVLVTASETVARAKERSQRRRSAAMVAVAHVDEHADADEPAPISVDRSA